MEEIEGVCGDARAPSPRVAAVADDGADCEPRRRGTGVAAGLGWRFRKEGTVRRGPGGSGRGVGDSARGGSRARCRRGATRVRRRGEARVWPGAELQTRGALRAAVAATPPRAVTRAGGDGESERSSDGDDECDGTPWTNFLTSHGVSPGFIAVTPLARTRTANLRRAAGVVTGRITARHAQRPPADGRVKCIDELTPSDLL